MAKKKNQTPGLYGILFAALLVALPTVWSATAKKPVSASDVSPGKPGPGASPDHAIPVDPAQVEAWFSKIIKHAKDRKDVEPDLNTAERHTQIVTVRQDGSGNFKTVLEAVNSVEKQGNEDRVIIDIGPGIYKEKITIDRYRPYITFYGNPKEKKPTLAYDASAPNFEMDSGTLTVEGDYFMAVNIEIMNTQPVGIALSVKGNYAGFYNVNIIGFKYALLDDQGRHFFKDCRIDGSTDIIIGDGRSIYLNSEIRVLKNEPESIIAAQARKNTDPIGGGFIFAHCKVIGTADKTLLGRTFMAGSRVVYAFSVLSDTIQPKGWYDDFETDYEKTAFFGEYMNKGAGANTSKRIKEPCIEKVTAADVKPFLNLDFIDAAEWLLPPPKLNAPAAH